jgi:hypothetical protein
MAGPYPRQDMNVIHMPSNLHGLTIYCPQTSIEIAVEPIFPFWENVRITVLGGEYQMAQEVTVG